MACGWHVRMLIQTHEAYTDVGVCDVPTYVHWHVDIERDSNFLCAITVSFASCEMLVQEHYLQYSFKNAVSKNFAASQEAQSCQDYMLTGLQSSLAGIGSTACVCASVTALAFLVWSSVDLPHLESCCCVRSVYLSVFGLRGARQ